MTTVVWNHADAPGHFPVLPAPRGNSRIWSQVVWVALSDGRVGCAQCLYGNPGVPMDWSLEGDDEGRPQLALLTENALRVQKAQDPLLVVAWALIEAPPHPNADPHRALAARASERRRLE